MVVSQLLIMRYRSAPKVVCLCLIVRGMTLGGVCLLGDSRTTVMCHVVLRWQGEWP